MADGEVFGTNKKIAEYLNDYLGSDGVEFRGHGSFLGVWFKGRFHVHMDLTTEQGIKLLGQIKESCVDLDFCVGMVLDEIRKHSG